jgi:predicted GNAT family N-acyltransferase
MATFSVIEMHTLDELNELLAVRLRVFVEEQGVPIEEEVDRYDVDPTSKPPAVYVLGRLDGECIATGRLLLDVQAGELPHIGRVAVVTEQRRNGYGAAIMAALHDAALARGFGGVTLAAQLHAVPFYEHLGYVAHGPVFLDAGIEHRQMNLRLR